MLIKNSLQYKEEGVEWLHSLQNALRCPRRVLFENLRKYSNIKNEQQVTKVIR